MFDNGIGRMLLFFFFFFFCFCKGLGLKMTQRIVAWKVRMGQRMWSKLSQRKPALLSEKVTNPVIQFKVNTLPHKHGGGFM